MDTGRQVIRWALPGWVTYFFFIVFIATNFLLPGAINKRYLHILEAIPDLLVSLGVASIPLGFMIYQLYHWTYWYFPMPAFGNKKIFDPIDRGRIILASVESKLDIKSLYGYTLIDAEETPFKKWWGPIKFKSIKIMSDYRHNWHLSDSLWYLALTEPRYKDSVDHLERRNQMLSDIYHSLGACYQAVGIAFTFYLLVFVYISIKEICDFIIATPSLFSFSALGVAFAWIITRAALFVANNLLVYFMIKIFKTGRKTSFEALLSLKHDVITHSLLNSSYKMLSAQSEIIEGNDAGTIDK